MPLVQVHSSYGFSSLGGNMAGSSVTASLPVRGRVSPVRRRLFFCENDEEEHQVLDNRRAVELQLAQIQDEQTQYWNFDFESGVPLRGRFAWEPATAGLGVERPSHPVPPPSAVKRPMDDSHQQISNKQARLDSLNNNNSVITHQTRITDFLKNTKPMDMVTKKRRQNDSTLANSHGTSF